MVELKYKNWDEISINTFEKLQGLFNLEKTGDEQIDNLNMNITMLSILCDVDEDTIADLPVNEFTELSKQCMFINEMPKAKIKDKYEINGQMYEVQLNVEDMTMNQYIDFQTFIKEKDKYLKNICACFLLPVGKKYGEGYKISKVVEDIGNSFSIVDAHSIFFFFTLLFQSLTVATLRCLEKKMKRGMKKMTKAEREMTEKAIMAVRETMSLLKNGGGLFG